jgi:hypothetical protein
VSLFDPAVARSQSISTCVLRDSLGNPAPDTIPWRDVLGLRTLHAFWGTPLAEVSHGGQVPVYGDTVVGSCRTTVMSIEQHFPGSQFPQVYLVDSQPPLQVVSWDSVPVNQGRRIASHPPVIDTATGLPAGGFVEDTLDVFHLNFFVSRWPDPADSLTARLETFYDSPALPRSDTRVDWTDSTRSAILFPLGDMLTGYEGHGTQPGLWEHRYHLDSSRAGPVVSTRQHETRDLAPPQIRSVWIDSTRQIGLQWHIHWLEHGNRPSPDTLLVWENALNRTHLENRQVFPFGAQVIAASIDNQRVWRATQRITDWQETVFFGDSFAFDHNRLVVDGGVRGYAFGFIFNPRTPYLPYRDTGYTREGDRTVPAQFYLGHDRSYSMVRPYGSYHVSLSAEDPRGYRDTVPITIVSRGLRPTRLSFTTHDPGGRARTRCYGRNCTGAGSGGLEGRLYSSSIYNVVWDADGWNLTAEAIGHDDDLGELANTRWSIGLTGKVSASEVTGRTVTFRGGDWPASNAAWGINNLRALLRLDTFNLGEALLLRVFFPRDARVLHPGDAAPTPNWFRYWLEAIRGTTGFTSLTGVQVLFGAEVTPRAGVFVSDENGAPDHVGLYASNERSLSFPTTTVAPGATPPVFRHSHSCSRAGVRGRQWQFPLSVEAEAALYDLVVQQHLLQSQLEYGYCRVANETETLEGIQALAWVWEHEAGHALHVPRMYQWARDNGCVGTLCSDTIGIDSQGRAIRMKGPWLYWALTEIGDHLGCGDMLQVFGSAARSISELSECSVNVGAWVEFVASVKAYRVPDASYAALLQKDWAYPGGQHAR